MTSKIRRTLFKTFLNTNTLISPTWSLAGDGTRSAKINYNPKTTEEQDIISDVGNISLDSYSPSMPFENRAKFGDAVFSWLENVFRTRGVGANCETEIVNVWLYDTEAGGYYYAERQAVSVQVDDFGGEGGTAIEMNYTVNFVGEPVIGAFNPTTLDFVALAVNTKLTTLVIGALTLAPLFATDKSWLYYEATTAEATVTMTSTLVGATIVQKDDDDTVVAQGDPASLDVGVNDLKVEVTVGSESVVYHIFVTRTA